MLLSNKHHLTHLEITDFKANLPKVRSSTILTRHCCDEYDLYATVNGRQCVYTTLGTTQHNESVSNRQKKSYRTYIPISSNWARCSVKQISVHYIRPFQHHVVYRSTVRHRRGNRRKKEDYWRWTLLQLCTTLLLRIISVAMIQH